MDITPKSASSILTLAILLASTNTTLAAKPDAYKQLFANKSVAKMTKLTDSIKEKEGIFLSSSCLDNTCFAVGMVGNRKELVKPAIYKSTDAETTWQPVTIPELPNENAGILQDITCSETLCMAVGAYVTDKTNDMEHPLIYVSQDKGNTWALKEFTEYGTMAKLSCIGAVCNAIANFQDDTPEAPLFSYVYRTNDGGQTWSRQTLSPVNPDIDLSLNDISCTKDYCLVVGNKDERQTNNEYIIQAVSFLSQDGGLTWSQPSVIYQFPQETTGSVESLSCTNNQCVVVGDIHLSNTQGDKPISFMSHDLGNTWSKPSYLELHDSLHGSLQDITCQANHCIAVGYAVNDQDERNVISEAISYTSEDGGATWSMPMMFENAASKIKAAFGVTCNAQQPGNCLAVGAYMLQKKGPMKPSIYLSKDYGLTWSDLIDVQL